jgi:hypothetical protein
MYGLKPLPFNAAIFKAGNRAWNVVPPETMKMQPRILHYVQDDRSEEGPSTVASMQFSGPRLRLRMTKAEGFEAVVLLPRLPFTNPSPTGIGRAIRGKPFDKIAVPQTVLGQALPETRGE